MPGIRLLGDGAVPGRGRTRPHQGLPFHDGGLQVQRTGMQPVDHRPVSPRASRLAGTESGTRADAAPVHTWKPAGYRPEKPGALTPGTPCRRSPGNRKCIRLLQGAIPRQSESDSAGSQIEAGGVESRRSGTMRRTRYRPGTGDGPRARGRRQHIRVPVGGREDPGDIHRPGRARGVVIAMIADKAAMDLTATTGTRIAMQRRAQGGRLYCHDQHHDHGSSQPRPERGAPYRAARCGPCVLPTDHRDTGRHVRSIHSAIPEPARNGPALSRRGRRSKTQHPPQPGADGVDFLHAHGVLHGIATSSDLPNLHPDRVVPAPHWSDHLYVGCNGSASYSSAPGYPLADMHWPRLARGSARPMGDVVAGSHRRPPLTNARWGGLCLR